jgi:multicomponent Na+:H+ antiporter subunit D
MNLILAPMVLSIGGGVASSLLYQKPELQKIVSFIFSVLIFVASLALLRVVYLDGSQALHLSNWKPPYGISFLADPFSVIMVAITGLINLGTSLYTFGGMEFKDDFRFFAPFFHLMMAGVFGAFLTADLFNLYVCFELLLLASFVLISLGRSRSQIEGAMKYVMINLISSTFFLCALGLMYGEIGALNMAEITIRTAETIDPSAVLMSGVLFLIAFSIKAALFPFNFWLPSSYHLCHPLISGLFAGLLTKVGIYAMLRMYPMIFVHDLDYYKNILLLIAGFTMVTGVLGAAADYNARRILSFHIISQLGYIALGVAIYTPFAIAATVFYFIHHIITKTNLYFAAGLLHLRFGHDKIKRMGSVYKSSPLLSLLFMLSALSLAGIPPLSGFFGKYFILRAAYLDDQWPLLFIGIGVGVLTLFSMIKIWNEAFWKDLPENMPAPKDRLPIGPILSTSLFAISIIGIGVFAGPLYDFALLAGEQIVNPEAYIRAMFGGQ